MPNPWEFVLQLPIIALVVFLIGSYVYVVRVIGPVAVEAGEPPVTRKNIVSFAAAMTMLFVASWWPMHQIGEQYLYSVHMFQHMVLSYFMPPLALLATPTWLLRTLIGSGRVYRAVRFLAHPVPAAIMFNVVVMVTHIPQLVNASTTNGLLHYTLHVLVVFTSLLMWMPVCGPLPEMRIGPLPTMIYLFAQSLIPTVPAAWLTFAESAVYEAYDKPFRLWGMTLRDDQQLAGAIMKTGGTIFLWTVIIVLWFRHYTAGHSREYQFRRVDPDTLTSADAERQFAATAAPRGIDD